MAGMMVVAPDRGTRHSREKVIMMRGGFLDKVSWHVVPAVELHTHRAGSQYFGQPTRIRHTSSHLRAGKNAAEVIRGRPFSDLHEPVLVQHLLPAAQIAQAARHSDVASDPLDRRHRDA